MMGISAG
jgi:ATP/maltotriose-dependent transcriptional regulator MalT